MTTIAQATSVTLSSGSNLNTANFSPASNVTVPAGSFLCFSILVSSVAGGGVTLDYDAAANATNLVSSQTIFIPELLLPLLGAAPLAPLLGRALRRSRITRRYRDG